MDKETAEKFLSSSGVTLEDFETRIKTSRETRNSKADELGFPPLGNETVDIQAVEKLREHFL